MKVKVHPLFFVAATVYTLLGGARRFAVAFLAVTLHEFAHCAVARLVGADRLTVTLMPYGASMRTEGDQPRLGAVLIAGPLANLVLASLSLSACWIFPELYGYLKGFVGANVCLATLNLLPAYPLDGGRLFRLLFKGKRSVLFTDLCTLLIGVAFLALAACKKNPAHLTFATFLLGYYFAFCGRRYRQVGEEDPLYAILKTDDEGRILPVKVRVAGKKRVRIPPSDVVRLCLTYPRETPLREVLKRERTFSHRI